MSNSANRSGLARTILTCAALAPFALHGATFPEGDPLPRIIENRSKTEVWAIGVVDKYLPVGIVKFYDMDNNPQVTIGSTGELFALNPGRKVKMAVCPSPRTAGTAIAITLGFTNLFKDEKPWTRATINFKQVGSTGILNPSITCAGDRTGMWFDENQLGNRIMATPSSTDAFVIVGK